MIRRMEITDYEEVLKLWKETPTLIIQEFEDSKEQIGIFLKRNKGHSFVALEDGKIVGTILCGQDGRRGCIYHMCVEKNYRQRKIGTHLVENALNELKKENIRNVYLVAFQKNAIGNAFWSSLGWELRADINNYSIRLKAE